MSGKIFFLEDYVWWDSSTTSNFVMTALIMEVHKGSANILSSLKACAACIIAHSSSTMDHNEPLNTCGD